MPGVIIFDPNDEDVGFSVGTDQAAGAYLDIENDALYLTDLSNIIQWEGDENNNLVYTWRSGRIRLSRPVNMGAALVEAESYVNTAFKLYAVLDGTLTLIDSIGVLDNDPFRLPGGYQSNLYEIEIISTDRISGISVAQSIFDLSAG